MSDKDKATGSDEAAKTDSEKPPMKEPEVRVNVRPVKHKTERDTSPEQRNKARKQNNENRKLAKKVEKNLESEIERKVADAGSGSGASRQSQYDAADEAVKDAASQTSRRKINRIDYEVGDDGGYHSGEVTPKESAPPDDEE
jgi:hypothetical protein